MATGTFYLRPSADISIGHEKMTAGSTTDISAYLLINEEVSDSHATYISHSTSSFKAETVSSKFSMSPTLSFPSNAKITGITIKVSGAVNGSDSSRFSHQVNIVANNITYSSPISVSFGDSQGEYPISSKAIDDINFLDTINSYIKQNNGSFPSVTLELISMTSDVESTKSIGCQISQIYLECEYTTGLNIHHRVSGTWIQAQKVYQKRNGAWAEITEDECKAILQSNIITK